MSVCRYVCLVCVCCSSRGFPCVGVRLVYWSLRCTATFVIRFHWSLLMAFSLHFSSFSASLRSLFKQSSHLSCGLPRFLQLSCFFVSDIFGNLSSFILIMYPDHLTVSVYVSMSVCMSVIMYVCQYVCLSINAP